MNDRVSQITSGFRSWLSMTGVAVVALWLAIGLFQAEGSDLRKTPVVRAVQAAKPSVVSIRGEKTNVRTASVDSGSRVDGMGAGVIIDPRGYIITNHHVVLDVKEINVTLADGESHIATLVAHDMDTDLAVIKIDVGKPLPVINLGTSSDLMIAEPVIAIGNPYGYSQSVTMGIISMLRRELQVSDAQYYENLIQTDAPINPGNSGGPLLNIDGEMIGVVVAVRTGAQGIAFGIPIDTVLDVVTDLLEEKAAANCQHGLQLADEAKKSPTEAMADAMMPVSALSEPAVPQPGIIIEAVDPGSAAETAGLQAGDILRRIGDHDVEREMQVHLSFLERLAGEAVPVTIQRDGNLLETTLVPESMIWSMLGLDLKPMAPSDFNLRFPTSPYDGGLMISRVRKDGPAGRKGVAVGDVLVGLDTWSTVSIGNVNWLINQPRYASHENLKVTVLRDGKTLFGYMNLKVAQEEATAQSGAPTPEAVESAGAAVVQLR